MTTTMNHQIASDVIRTRVGSQTHLQSPSHPRTASLLRKLANRRTDWNEVARLYEVELNLARADDDERTRLLLEMALVVPFFMRGGLLSVNSASCTKMTG